MRCLKLPPPPSPWTRTAFCYPDHTHFFRVEPFEGANIEQAALEFTGIKLDHPLRQAVSEEQALTEIFRGLRKSIKADGCKRAILVGHNSSFDLGFVNAAVARCDLKRNPLAPFLQLRHRHHWPASPTAKTVLAKACQAAGNRLRRQGGALRTLRHTRRTAELFCAIVNRWKEWAAGTKSTTDRLLRTEIPAQAGIFYVHLLARREN